MRADARFKLKACSVATAPAAACLGTFLHANAPGVGTTFKRPPDYQSAQMTREKLVNGRQIVLAGQNQLGTWRKLFNGRNCQRQTIRNSDRAQINEGLYIALHWHWIRISSPCFNALTQRSVLLAIKIHLICIYCKGGKRVKQYGKVIFTVADQSEDVGRSRALARKVMRLPSSFEPCPAGAARSARL